MGTIYVTGKAEKNNWIAAPASGRPEALPVWNHLKKDKLDAVSAATSEGATLRDSDLASRLPAGTYAIMLETNRSYDYNSTYAKAVSGVCGQPSLVYRALLSVGKGPGKAYFEPIGTGSVDGSDGAIRKGLSGIDSALSLFSSMSIEFGESDKMGGIDKKAERHARQFEATRAEIKAAAWVQVSERGAASLSLRAVAAAIGFNAPALYRYFPSRDSLVTALIIDAYQSLALAQNKTLDSLEGKSWEECLRGLGLAYRAWATSQPAAFYIIFGAPIPGYMQPTEETLPAAGSSLSALIQVLTMAMKAGDLALPLEPPATASLKAAFTAWSDAVHHNDPEILYLAFSIANRIQGLTLAELGGQFAPFLKDCGESFERELERIIKDIKA